MAEDIIITLPASLDFDQWHSECESVADDFHKTLRHAVGKLPSRDVRGGRCWVIHQGLLRGYHIIEDACYCDGFECAMTGQGWPEGNYIMRFGHFYELEPPIRKRGFQGWRYFDFEELRVNKGFKLIRGGLADATQMRS